MKTNINIFYQISFIFLEEDIHLVNIIIPKLMRLFFFQIKKSAGVLHSLRSTWIRTVKPQGFGKCSLTDDRVVL